jgi:Alkylmercury lyase
MLFFRSEEHVDRWCEAKGLPRGALLSIRQLWGLARAWYGDRLSQDWRRKTSEEAEELFEQIGLTGPFWKLT